MLYSQGKKPSTNSVGSRVDSIAGLDVLLKETFLSLLGI